ncbi:N-glycosylase/DNA lyase isoform X1 [Schistocerca serialis cubense]|uniref:N-glycosylase/DNA lyase isoform X1 n=2 Tax=Schistocerca serialis cubense TaxID=2023355 RepID=UPI00214E01F4|nr:N-glycosylase/DNA lyase isoform X1 [Schistocerca serialis cubense]
MINLLEEPWYRLLCKRRDLNLQYTLGGGQSFRWKKINENEWWGIFCSRFWMLKQTDNFILYKVAKQVTPSKKCSVLLSELHEDLSLKKFLAHLSTNSVTLSEEEKKLQICDTADELNGVLLCKYLRLDTNLEECYNRWGQRDPVFQKAASKCHGVRLLCQEPLETILTFICSSNNHIKRITSMIEKLCSLYGEEIGVIDGVKYFDFPDVEQLVAPSVHGTLAKAGFGYRAGFIHKSACMIQELGGYEWINKLKLLPYEAARKELVRLPGVGFKVADCICLMSLGHLNAVPVDTHIHQVAKQHYMKSLRNAKTLSNTLYLDIMKFFQDIHGPDAGWAQTVLFCADLKNIGNEQTPEENGTGETKTKKKRTK